MKPIIIGSRGSRLALIQAESVKAALEAAHAGLQVTIKVIATKGDLILDRTLDKIGGKGLFVKEIQQALLDESIDLAVHSMKDVPGVAPEGLAMAAITRREDPRDVLVTTQGFTPETLPMGAVIGTSSLRRQAQIRCLRPDCQVVPLRGNVQTRLQKMKDQQLTGILLAAAGLKRLEMLDQLAHHPLELHRFVPAVGQGALGCEIRETDTAMKALLAPLEDADTRVTVMAERAFLNRLEGDCHVPVGAFGRLEENQLVLTGMVAAADGRRRLQETVAGEKSQAESLGQALAEQLIAQGAWELMKGGAGHE